jgi:hypothetical protein
MQRNQTNKNGTAPTLAAKQLMTGDVIAIRKAGEIITSIVRRSSHVYVETDYTRQTGCGAYDLDKMQLVRVAATLGGKGKLAKGVL